MKILVSGATGLIGRALVAASEAAGHQVTALSRYVSHERPTLLWDPGRGTLEASPLDGFDAVVHLAGDNIAKGRWTSDKKRKIRDSRVAATHLLCERSGRRQAQGFRLGIGGGNIWRSRRRRVGRGQAAGNGISGRSLRGLGKGHRSDSIGRHAGLLCPLRRGARQERWDAFSFAAALSLGLGGPLGDGRQWLSWIALADAVGAIRHAIATPVLSGPVNVVAPNPVTNAEFTAAYAAALGRPAFFRVPRLLARVALGEMADEVLFASARVKPEALLSTGYPFRFPELKPALRALLR